MKPLKASCELCQESIQDLQKAFAFSVKKDNLFYNIIFSGSLELNDTEKAILSSFKLIAT